MKKFDEMPDNARVWIYQINRNLSPEEELEIQREADSFVANWTAHGSAMDAAVQIFYHRLIVLAANEEMAQTSGCGIDKSVKFFQELGKKLNLDFFQRTTVLYMLDGEWKESPLHVFWAMRKAKLIQDSTLVLDNTIKSVQELKKKWVVKFEDSWHNEFWSK